MELWGAYRGQWLPPCSRVLEGSSGRSRANRRRSSEAPEGKKKTAGIGVRGGPKQPVHLLGHYRLRIPQ